jgi:hypothetical protein
MAVLSSSSSSKCSSFSLLPSTRAYSYLPCMLFNFSLYYSSFSWYFFPKERSFPISSSFSASMSSYF